MSRFKYFTTFIFVFGFNGCECVDERSCHENTVSYEWQRKNNSEPGILNAIEMFSVPPTDNLFGTIVVQSRKRRDNFNLTVLVKPFVANQTQCPPDPNTETDLRKFFMEYRFEKDIELDKPRLFSKAYTGCYYFIMTNDKNQHWLTGPKHFKSDYVSFDTMLQCNVSDSSAITQPNCIRTKLDIKFRIAMKCLELQIKMFELEDKNPDTLKKVESNKIPAKNVCRIKLNDCNGTKAIISRTCKKSSEGITLEASILFGPTCGIDNSWNVHVSWTGLKAAGAYYYSTFSQNYICSDARYSDLNTWLPATKLDLIDHHWRSNTECVVPTIPQKNINVVIFMYITMAISLILICIYWIGKLIRNCLYQNKSNWKESNVIISVPEEEWLCDIGKSTDILLVYARDSDEFTKAIEHLRDNLKQKCNYQIRDIYSDNELQNVSKLTVPVWIEKIMKNGCKIIWIDTPKFRLRLHNDQLNEDHLNYDGGFDFRDTSLRYAVNLAKTTFENTNQYRRHFVLRINGFDEFNGIDDPLLTISPYVRYHYPEHIDYLCEHLNK